MATQKEMEIELAALRKQLKTEQGLTETTTTQWQTMLAEKEQQLAAFQKAAQEREAALKAACPPPESGCSVNVSFVVNDEGTTLTGGQLTLRADRYDQALDVMSYLAHLMTERKWKIAAAPKPAPAAKENKAVAILKEAGAAPQVIAAATQAPAHIKPVLEVRAVHMTVEPKPGGRVNVNFFGNDRKQPHNQFADIYVSRAAEQLAKDMAFLDPEVFTGPGEYAIEMLVGYTLSDKLNTKGNPYKDVQYIKQA